MAEYTSDADLRETVRLAGEATRGPWHPAVVVGGWDGVSSQYGDICELALNEPENAKYIAHAHPDRVLAMAEEILRLRARERALANALKDAINEAEYGDVATESQVDAWRELVADL